MKKACSFNLSRATTSVCMRVCTYVGVHVCVCVCSLVRLCVNMHQLVYFRWEVACFPFPSLSHQHTDFFEMAYSERRGFLSPRRTSPSFYCFKTLYPLRVSSYFMLKVYFCSLSICDFYISH